MKFKNTTERAIRVAGYGWIAPGGTLELRADDEAAIQNIKTMPAFKAATQAKKKATTKKDQGAD